MSPNLTLDRRKNKNFVIHNQYFLKKYALKNYDSLGKGIIVINLLLLKKDILDEQDINSQEIDSDQEITIHHPISYIPKNNFWFKMLNLKIKKKHEISIQEKDLTEEKFLIVFVKDASIEHFSIYSVKF